MFLLIHSMSTEGQGQGSKEDFSRGSPRSERKEPADKIKPSGKAVADSAPDRLVPATKTPSKNDPKAHSQKSSLQAHRT